MGDRQQPTARAAGRGQLVTTVVEHEPDVDRRISEDLRRVFVPILDVRTRRRLWKGA